MGAVKKVFKGIGSLFGIGGSSSTPTVQQVATDPTPTSVQDVSGDTSGQDTTDAKKKKRRGFASTSTSLIGDANSTNKDTLG